MNKIKLIVLFFALSVFAFCSINLSAQKYLVKQLTDKNGYKYETVINDPFKARIYTLKNGLKIYLTVNKDEPRILTLIAVKAGSKYDPPETTGLAHYLEHMTFKGSSKMGTINWEKEQVLLQNISDLYEKHRMADDTLKKKEIYAQIDSISYLAAQYAVSNEYDKMISTIGAKYTNAGTSNESTVYINNIPTNELEKWLVLERERFGDLVLRLFHTELETVYEEFNMSQDNDYRKAHKALMEGLFKKHPYGTQTTIGKAEHIKNPSMINIHKYFDTYYVPNNIAICMSGDLDFEKTIMLIDKHWGDFEPNNDIPVFEYEPETPITEPVVKEVFGPDAEFIRIAFRFESKDKKAQKILTLIHMLLNNHQAGLIDLDLVQKQKVLSANTYAYFMQDYGLFGMSGNPREGQTLEEVKDLLLAELDSIKQGRFDDWLLEAVVNDLRLSRIQQVESNWRAYAFVSAFIKSTEWIEEVEELDELAKITKEQIIEFANKHLHNNYVAVYKRTGKDENVVKVKKPKITSINVNRTDESAFMKEFNEIESGRLQPVFIDFEKEISNTTFLSRDFLPSPIEFRYIKNKTNELFNLYYIIDMGKYHDKKLALAVKYLPYIGTTKYSAADLQKEFFKLGLDMHVSAGSERSYIYISGIAQSFEKGIELLEHVLAEAKPDKKAYDDFVDGILKKRADAKLNKRRILWSAMMNYGKYGKKSSFTNILTEAELKSIEPEELTNILKKLYSYKHHIFYYGQKELNEAKSIVEQYHNVPTKLLEYPEPEKFVELETDSSKIYFVNYDMVQANIILISKDKLFNKSLMPYAGIYNDYYGSGLSSIVFQGVREAKGLAYAAYSSFTIPGKPDRSHYIYAFVGTQPDKIDSALTTMLGLLNEMLNAPKQFENSKQSILKKIETDRIIKKQIFWTYLSNFDKGINYDYRKDIYEKVKDMNIEQIKQFFTEHIEGKKYILLVLGNKENIDMNVLSKYGEVKELTLEEIFNY